MASPRHFSALALGGTVGLMCLGAAHAEELPFTHMTPDGHPPLTSASVQSILQDRLGFVWLAFYTTGISRYDGHGLDQYSIGDGLADVTVRELVEDVRGHLWVGSESGLAVSTKPLGDYNPSERIHFTSKIGKDTIIPNRTRRNCLVATSDGWVWKGTGRDGLRLYRVRGGKLESEYISTDVFDGGRDEPVTAMTVRSDGTVWAAVGDGFFLVVGRDRKRTVVDPQQLGADRRRASVLHEGPSGSFWIGYFDGGVSRFDSRRKVPIEDFHSPVQEHISSLLESTAGELWAASLGNGMARFSVDNDRAPDHYHPDDGLIGDTLWHLMEGRDGALWVGQNGGLSRLSPDYKAIGRYTKASLAEPSVFAILPPTRPGPASSSKQGVSFLVACPRAAGKVAETPLWLGTGGGLFGICGGRVAAFIDIKQGLASNSVYALGTDGQGRLWVGTALGLNSLAFGRHSKPLSMATTSRKGAVLGTPFTISTLPGARSPIYAIKNMPISTGERGDKKIESLWFAGTGGLYALIGVDWFFFEHAAGVPATGTTGIALDGNGHVWVGTADSGLLRSREPVTLASLKRQVKESQQIQQLSLSALMSIGIGEVSIPVFEPVWDLKRGAPTNSIRTLLRLGDKVFVSTAAGLAVLHAESIEQLAWHDSRTGLGGDSVAGITLSPTTNRLWVSQNGGLAELDAKRSRPLRVITKAHGLSDNEAWAYGAVASGADGTIYLGTPKGVSIVRPWLMLPRAESPLLRWRRIESHRDEAGHFEITFEYSALNYANPGSMRFKSRLLGYNSAWSTPTRGFKLRFTHLPPATYTFELLGATSPDTWPKTPLWHRFTVPAAEH